MNEPTERDIEIADLIREDLSIRAFGLGVSAKRIASHRLECNAKLQAELESTIAQRDGARDQASILKAKLDAATSEFRKVASVVEPHWNGAGLQLESDWMIKEIVGTRNSQETQIEDLQAKLTAALKVIDKADNALRCANNSFFGAETGQRVIDKALSSIRDFKATLEPTAESQKEKKGANENEANR